MEDYTKKYSINNVKPSPDDSRDWVAESIYLVGYQLPKIVDHRNKLQPIRNQGEQGSCAAQTAACMKEWQEYYDVGFNKYMSPQFIYNNRTNQDSEGMYGRDVMIILSKLGSCSEETYPYYTLELPQDISKSVKEEAMKYKIKSYAQIKTIEGLKKALYINGPCYISFPVYNHSDTMWKPKNGEKRQGGHAMTIVGYNEEGFIIRNSWGPYWSNNGYCTYTYSDWGSHWEIWTTIDDKSYIKPNIEPDVPSPNIVPNEESEIKICCGCIPYVVKNK